MPPPHLEDWKGKTIPEDQEQKSMVFDISQAQSTEITYNGQSFKPSMAIVTLPSGKSLRNERPVGCEIIFVEPINQAKDDRYKIFSGPDASIRCDCGDRGEIDLHEASKASLFIKDPSDTLRPVQELDATKRSGVVSCSIRELGEEDIWVIRKDDYNHWTARYDTKGEWDTVRGEVESFSRDHADQSTTSRAGSSGILDTLYKVGFTLLDYYG
ncbi:hypothetical protein L486_02530 [Kwoniella mangroviensis CBS 10435]|uniref:Uncharacterized protein n=1 Tax=Kwoniella mangroviensis CBS 10435 TaxID=1331196 RepID=A0A1B9IWE9_9TREE|nr:hypothetical protein L486_02530 [Kwoniella mangroviensis CBS 10435]